jgi:hypothetical protein
MDARSASMRLTTLPFCRTRSWRDGLAAALLVDEIDQGGCDWPIIGNEPSILLVNAVVTQP